MNDAIFQNMQEQLAPSDRATDRLMERLAETPRMLKVRWTAVAAAACAALALAVVPILRQARQPVQLHSYVLSDSSTPIVMDTTAGGDTDAGVGGPVEEENSVEEFTGEIAPGVLPIESVGGEEAAAQENAIAAYTNLMAYFEREYGPESYPDWYGGAYVVTGDMLFVNVVHSVSETADKAFFLEIQDMAQSTSVGFGGTKYSLNQLLELQKAVIELPELKALSSWGCGVDEETGRLELTVPQADEALLAALAKLDPDDDAITVEIGELKALVE